MTKLSDEAVVAHKIAFNDAHEALLASVRKLQCLSNLLQCALDNPDEPNIGSGITELLDDIALEITDATDTNRELWNLYSIDPLGVVESEKQSA